MPQTGTFFTFKELCPFLLLLQKFRPAEQEKRNEVINFATIFFSQDIRGIPPRLAILISGTL